MSFLRKQESTLIVIPAQEGIHTYRHSRANGNPLSMSFLRKQESILTVIPVETGIHLNRHPHENGNL
jgi:hypothetical protein